MSFLYDTGARVQELIDIKVCDVILDSPAVVVLTGKGNKTRRVPLMKNTITLLERYIVENKLDKPWKNEYPLFTNNQNNKLTKEGLPTLFQNMLNYRGKHQPLYL
jgi:integrase/recombinase XerD